MDECSKGPTLRGGAGKLDAVDVHRSRAADAAIWAAEHLEPDVGCCGVWPRKRRVAERLGTGGRGQRRATHSAGFLQHAVRRGPNQLIGKCQTGQTEPGLATLAKRQVPFCEAMAAVCLKKSNEFEAQVWPPVCSQVILNSCVSFIFFPPNESSVEDMANSC